MKQVYRKNLATGELLPVSVTADGTPGDYLSIEPSIAADGAVVAFYSPATNLVDDGGNQIADVLAKVFTSSTPSESGSPTGGLRAWPNRLPANRGSRPVLIGGVARDDGGLGTVTFAVTDEYGEVQPVIDPMDAAGQTSTTWRRQVTLDTALHGDDRSRDYTITATVSDLAGNVTTTSTRVLVQGKWTG